MTPPMCVTVSMLRRCTRCSGASALERRFIVRAERAGIRSHDMGLHLSCGAQICQEARAVHRTRGSGDRLDYTLTASGRRRLSGRHFLEQFLQLAAFVHFRHDVRAADELPVDIQLRNGWPIGEVFDCLSHFFVL